MKFRLLLVGLVCCISPVVQAADWPQFRGPNRDGVSRETGLLKSWPKNGPKLNWTFKDAGLGFSSFAVVEGKLFTLGTRGDDEIVLALDAEKGTELWSAKIAPIFTFKSNTWGDGPRGTPTIDGKFLYALGGQGELVCLDISAKGKQVWRTNLIKNLDGEMMTEWGYSESPLIDGPNLICTPGGEKGTLAALDKTTGKVVWRSTELTDKAPYSSIVVATLNGVRQYVQTSSINGNTGGNLVGVSAKDGTLLWKEKIASKSSYSIASSPIVVGEKVYVSEGNGYGCHYYDFTQGKKPKDLYGKAEQKLMKNNHGGCVLVGGHVYGFTDPPASWVCQELETGKEAWSDDRRNNGTRSAAISAADGMLYLLSDEGEVELVEPSPVKINVVGKFTIPQRSDFLKMRPTSQSAKVWAHPVVANGRLYVREAELIFCYDVRK